MTGASADDFSDFLESMGMDIDREFRTVKYDTLYPWMTAHRFVVVRSVQQIREIVDAAIASGSVALDLETEGFDNRVYIKDGKPYNYKKIVGYCICYDGITGYYIPVAHKAQNAGNLPYEEAGVEIRRLCEASQPTQEGNTVKHGPVKVYFWNAKFDTEWLYHITGLDFWHSASFEDGNLLAFCVNTSWELGLKAQAFNLLSVPVPDYQPGDLKKIFGEDLVFTVVPKKETGNKPPTVNAPYKMIEMSDLFPRGKPVDFAALHPEEAVIYACSDAICTYKILHERHLHKMWDKVKLNKEDRNKVGVDTYTLEKQVSQVLRNMERNRFKIDKNRIGEILKQAEEESADLERKILESARKVGFPSLDINSTQQVGSFLFDPEYLDIHPKPEKTEKSGVWKTGTDELETVYNESENPNEVLKDILKYRQISKITGTYLENLKAAVDTCPEGTLRSNFNQTGATTGRFTAPAGDPSDGCGVPIHGIPSSEDDRKPEVARALRKCFVCEPDEVVVKIDFAGQELRAVTNISGEPLWEKEFLYGTGDLHTLTAQAFFNKETVSPTERKQAKIANFALVYGGGPASIQAATGCSKEVAVERKKAFDNKVPVFATWIKKQHTRVKKDLGVRNSFGRWLAIPDANITANDVTLKDKEIEGKTLAEVSAMKEAIARKIRSACERYSVNYPIQSAGADIMKIAMVSLMAEFRKRNWESLVKMRLTVHDEIVFTVKKSILSEAIPVIRSLMEGASRCAWDWDRSRRWRIPMLVEILVDVSWAAKYEWDSMVHGSPIKPGKEPKDTQIVIPKKIYKKNPAGAYLTDASGNFIQEEVPYVYRIIPPFLEGFVHREDTEPPPPPDAKKERLYDPITLPETSDYPVLEITIHSLTPKSAKIFRSVVEKHPPDSKADTVCLSVSHVYGNKKVFLIPPSEGILVNKPSFLEDFDSRNL